jgi:transposase
LARLFRAGELTPIYVPDEEDEAVRDLVRARHSAVIDQRKVRQRLKGFRLRLGFRYSGKTSWHDAHQRYLARLKMPRPQQQIAFQEYVEAINVQTERLQRLTQAMVAALNGWKWEPVVRALMSLRGVQEVVGMTLVAEAGDLSRFEDPLQLMAFLGLTPASTPAATNAGRVASPNAATARAAACSPKPPINIGCHRRSVLPCVPGRRNNPRPCATSLGRPNYDCTGAMKL